MNKFVSTLRCPCAFPIRFPD
uniref:Uncharacterized protein n=1 Tax=Arundo donax TaxID=35708 RepID=A0A0A9BT94_ARUDO